MLHCIIQNHHRLKKLEWINFIPDFCLLKCLYAIYVTVFYISLRYCGWALKGGGRSSVCIIFIKNVHNCPKVGFSYARDRSSHSQKPFTHFENATFWVTVIYLNCNWNFVLFSGILKLIYMTGCLSIYMCIYQIFLENPGGQTGKSEIYREEKYSYTKRGTPVWKWRHVGKWRRRHVRKWERGRNYSWTSAKGLVLYFIV